MQPCKLYPSYETFHLTPFFACLCVLCFQEKTLKLLFYSKWKEWGCFFPFKIDPFLGREETTLIELPPLKFIHTLQMNGNSKRRK